MKAPYHQFFLEHGQGCIWKKITTSSASVGPQEEQKTKSRDQQNAQKFRKWDIGGVSQKCSCALQKAKMEH